MQYVERAFGELRLGIGAVAARGPQLLRLHCAPSFAARWLAAAPAPHAARLPRAGGARRRRRGLHALRRRRVRRRHRLRAAVAGVVRPPRAAEGRGPAARNGDRHAALLAGPGGGDPLPERPVALPVYRGRQQAGTLAGLVRGQRPAGARAVRPALRPRLPVVERRRQAGRGLGGLAPGGTRARGGGVWRGLWREPARTFPTRTTGWPSPAASSTSARRSHSGCGSPRSWASRPRRPRRAWRRCGTAPPRSPPARGAGGGELP